MTESTTCATFIRDMLKGRGVVKAGQVDTGRLCVCTDVAGVQAGPETRSNGQRVKTVQVGAGGLG